MFLLFHVQCTCKHTIRYVIKLFMHLYLLYSIIFNNFIDHDYKIKLYKKHTTSSVSNPEQVILYCAFWHNVIHSDVFKNRHVVFGKHVLGSFSTIHAQTRRAEYKGSRGPLVVVKDGLHGCPQFWVRCPYPDNSVVSRFVC